MEIQAQFTDVWERSIAYYHSHLSDRDRMHVTEIKSQQDLLQHIRALEAKYSNNKVSQTLKKTQPFVAQLRSFSGIISIFIQSDPKISALIWGPLALILELAARHQQTLEFISGTLEQFERVLPRFQEYLKEFGSRELSERLRGTLIIYYAELIALYQDSIKFLRVRPVKNLLLLNRPTIHYNLSTSTRLTSLRSKTTWVEEEVGWAKYRVQQEQHSAIMRVLNAGSSTGAVSGPAFKLPYRSLPYNRNHQFQFRENLLQRLHVELQPGTNATSLRAAGLHGLGGVGKTQVALEFAYRHSEYYDAIFWVAAETEAKLRESLLSHVREVMDTPEDTPQQDTVLIKTFQRWLMTASIQSRLVRWLIIFDNIEDERVIERLWPRGSHGSIILTSRNNHLSRTFGHDSIEVPLFTKEESALFMMSLSANPDNADDGETEIVAEIAKRLGYLPLVLDHIGSYIRRTATTYRTFKQFYQDFDTNLLFQPGIIGPSYEKSIRNTWTMTLSTIDDAPRVLMETLALFDSDGVPIELFENCDKEAKMHNGPSDEFPKLGECLKDRLPERKTTDEAIAALLSGSLIGRHRDGDRISCHRIVREAVLQSLSVDSLAVHFDWAVFALNACFPRTPRSAPLLEDWDRCAVFHPQISTLLDIYNRFSALLRPPILLCEVVRRCAWYLFERGNFEGASSMVKSACNILERVGKTGNHPGYYHRYICRLTADLYSTFGSIEYELNLPLHGRPWFERADKHRRQLIENETAEAHDLETMAIVDGNIALTYLADGVPNSSIESYKLLLDTFDSPSSRGIWAANLSIAYRIDKQFGESLVWSQNSLGWTSSEYGEQSLSLAIIYFNLGCTFISLKKDNEALTALETCLAIRQQKSPTHAYTGFTCHKIGTLLRARGDLSRAAAFFRSAIDILKDCESREGGCTRSQFALAATLEEIGDFDEAEKLFEDVITFMKDLGEDADRDKLTEEKFEQFVLYCHR